MARQATALAYGANIVKLGLSLSELAILRAICWRFSIERGRTDPLAEAELARLTGVDSPVTQGAAIRHLRQLGLVSYEHANKVPVRPGEKRETTIAYVYHVNLARLRDIRPESVRREEEKAVR